MAVGVQFFSDASGPITINGNFSVSSSGSNAYGVRFDNIAPDLTQTVNGHFSIFSNGAVDGVCYESTAGGGTPSGTPTFYSNKTDSGNWKTYGGREIWNGNQTGTTTDAAFALTQFYDTPTNVQYGSHFSFLAISVANIVASKIIFDAVLTNVFGNLSDGYVTWSVLTTNIRNLLS